MRYRIFVHLNWLLRYCILGLTILTLWQSDTTVFSAQEPNQPDQLAIRMMHIFIQADTEIVRFDNIWVFGRESIDGPWQIGFVLPQGAELLRIDDPNSAVVSGDGKSIKVNLTADSLIDSVGFSYLLPNQNGKCILDIVLPYQVDSAVISVSGSATGFSSKVLSPSKYRQQSSRFSRVYVANNLPANAPIDIKLTALPCKDSFSRLLKIICIVGLVLILALAACTIYRYPKSKIEDSDIDATGSQ